MISKMTFSHEGHPTFFVHADFPQPGFDPLNELFDALMPHASSLSDMEHKFLDREDVLKTAAILAERNFRFRCSSNQKDHNFLLVVGGSGVGKTRFGQEIGRLSSHDVAHQEWELLQANPQFLSAMNSPVYLRIDFGNGCKFDHQLDSVSQADVRLNVRLLAGWLHISLDTVMAGEN